MRWSLKHRYEAVKSAVKKGKRPSGELEQQLYDLLEGKEVDVPVTRAHDVYEATYKREVMEAFLLARVSDKDIEEILEIPPGVTHAYAHLFFDIALFVDELDRIEYGHSYAKTPFGAELKKFAVEMGPESLKIRVSHGKYTIPSLSVMSEIRTTAYMLAQRAKSGELNPADTKTALEWAKLALKASDEEEERDQAGVEDINIALEAKDETTNEEKSGLKPGDILQ